MAKDLIRDHGQDIVVREDTARAFRGVHWALWSLMAFVIIAGVLFAIFFFGALSTGNVESPAQLQNTNSR